MNGVRINRYGGLALGLAVGVLMGSNFQHAVQAANGAACPTATKTPAPVKNSHIVLNLVGNNNKQTATFRSPGPFTVSWHVTYDDPSQKDGSLLSLTLYDAQNNELDLLINTSAPTQDASVEHADCTKGCYFKIDLINMKYHITVSS